MPTRIKPLQRLLPCVLTLESLQKITALIESSFPNSSDIISFSATDDIWEIYGERRESFLHEVASRQKLDSFIVEVISQGDVEKIEMVFDEKEAKVYCVANSQQANWFEHFMIDLKKSLLPSSFAELVYFYGQSNNISFDLRAGLLAPHLNPSLRTKIPYCRIVIKQKQPSPFIENIKANIVSNIIWAILVFVFGVLFTIVVQQSLGR